MTSISKFACSALGSPALAVLLLSTLAPATAAAAVAQPAANAVEEIIVTAERRSENLQDTPIAITAFTSRNLEARGVTNLQNITNFAPNVEISSTKRPAGGGTAIAAFIRGVGTGDFQIPTDPAVGLYVDGVYVARTVGGLMSVADIDHIEVLKGPQGTLFGRNTLGGAISVITTQPRLSGGLTGKGEVRFGDYGRKDALVSVNGPIVDGKLGGKLSFTTLNFDGWQKGLITGLTYGSEHRSIARGSLLWQVNDKFDVQLTGDWMRQRQAAVNGTLLGMDPTVSSRIIRFNQFGAPYLNASLGLPANARDDARWVTDVRDTNETSPIHDDADVWGTSLAATYDVSDSMKLKSTTAYRDMDAYISVAGDGSPYPANSAASPYESRQVSQEFELSGDALDGRLHYVAGAYFFREIASSRPIAESFHGTYEATHVASDAADNINYYKMDARSQAVFAQVTAEVFPKVELVLGARGNKDEKSFVTYVLNPQRGTVTLPTTRADDTWNSFTPRVGVNWKPTDDAMIYASYAKGFKSGGFGTAINGVVPSYDPEELTTYELGAKTQWFDHRLTVNAATFYSEYDGVQITILLPPSLRTTQNGGTAHIKGFELDVEAVPIDGLRLNASVGYNHGRFVTVSPGAVAASAVNGLTHAPGTRLPYVPDWSATVGGEYGFDIADLGRANLRADWSWKSETNMTLADPTSYMGAYGLTNIRAGFTPRAMDHLEIALAITNLTNKTYFYYRNTSRTTGNDLGSAGDPRLTTVQLRYTF